MFCQKKHAAKFISQDFKTFCCYQYGCYTKRSDCEVEKILKNMNGKLTYKQRGYNQILEFYTSAIKCLQMDKERLEAKMKQNDGKYQSPLKNQIQYFFKTGKVPDFVDSQQWQTQIRLLQAFNIKSKGLIKQFLDKQQKLRSLWLEDSKYGFKDAVQSFSNFALQNLSTQLQHEKDHFKKYYGFESKTQFHHLKKVTFPLNKSIKSIQKTLILLSIGSPNLTTITIPSSYSKLQSNYIVGNLSQFKNLFTLRVQKPPIQLKEIVDQFQQYYDKVKHLNLSVKMLEISSNNIFFQMAINSQEERNKLKIKLKHHDRFPLLEKQILNYLYYLDFGQSPSMFSTPQILNYPKLKSLVTSKYWRYGYFSELDSNIQQLKMLEYKVNIVQHLTNLKKLWLDGCNLKGFQLDSLKKIPKLELLSLYYDQENSIQKQEIEQTIINIKIICEFNTQLLQLRLDNRQIGNIGAMLIGKHLKNLNFLSINQCKISNNGTIYLSQLHNLETLVMENHQMNRIFINNKNLKNALFVNKEQRKIKKETKIMRNKNIFIKNQGIKMNHNKQHCEKLFQNLSKLQIVYQVGNQKFTKQVRKADQYYYNEVDKDQQ